MARIFILGVNPFEDLPGYQLLGLLQSEKHHDIIVGDDSKVALQVLKSIGADIEYVPHPSIGLDKYAQKVVELCKKHDADLLIPSTDTHLSALAYSLNKYPSLGALHPPLKWLASERLYDKWLIQEWISRFVRTPTRWEFRNENDLRIWETQHKYPVMVKGMRKGAVKCNDGMEAIVARNAVLKSPANKFRGGAYLESHVHGEEHSLFIVKGASGQMLATFGFRKIAKTQSGTTLCGQVDDNLPFRDVFSKLISSIHGPMTLEIEWCLDNDGKYWIFEANPRFPSWIGSLGKFGQTIVESYVRTLLDPDRTSQLALLPPKSGTLFYRLPESGYLTLPLTFGNSSLNTSFPHKFDQNMRANHLKPLWRGCSPHQFMIK